MTISPTQYLREANMRCTAQREDIVRVLLDMSGHFSAEGLHRRLQEEDVHVSRSTVYRTVSALEERGLIRHVFQSDGHSFYEKAEEHHDHLLCVQCGKVMEFRDEGIEELQDQVCERFGFQPHDHRLRITGLCRECRE